MKTNEKKDLQVKTKNELVKLVQDAQTELMQLKLDHQQNKLKNTSAISRTRDRIAVIKTFLNGKPAEVAVEAKETKKKEDKK